MQGAGCSLCICMTTEVEEAITVFLSYWCLSLDLQNIKQVLQLQDRQALHNLHTNVDETLATCVL